MVRLWSSSHPHARPRGGQQAQSEDAEREREQEKLVKLGQQILQTKTGETEFKEVRTLALDPPSVRDGPPCNDENRKGIHTASLKFTNDDDNVSENSDDSCPALGRSASEEENILGTRKDYGENLAEARRRKTLNEVKHVTGSTNMNGRNLNLKSTTDPSSVSTSTASDHGNDRNTTKISRTENLDAKKKGKWNGWFNKKGSDKGTKNNKSTRINEQTHSKPTPKSDVTNQANSIANHLVPHGERKNSMNLRISTKDPIPISAATGREGSAPSTPKEITPGYVQRQRELFEANMNAVEHRTYAGDPSPRNTSDAGRQILVHSTPKTEPTHSEMKTNNDFGSESASVQSNTEWTPVDPDADPNPSSNLSSVGKIPQRQENKRYDCHTKTVDFVSQSRGSESMNVKSMTTDQYYESLAKIGKTSPLDSTSKYQVHHTIAESSKESTNRHTIDNIITETADEADEQSEDWASGANGNSNISFNRPTANNDLAVTAREQSDDWSQSLSLNTLEKNVAKQFDGLKSWFSSLGTPSANAMDPSGGAKAVQKTKGSIDETKAQDSRARSGISRSSKDGHNSPTMSDDQTDSVSKRVNELSGAIAGKSSKEAQDDRNDVKDGLTIKPSTPELVTISSIEIPAIEVEELADEEYSISVLGLDKKHNGEATEHELQQRQAEDKLDDERQHSHSDHRDGLESISEEGDRHGRSVSYANHNQMDSHQKTSRGSSRTGRGGHTESTIEVAGKKVRLSRSRSRSRARSRSRSKSRSAQVRISKAQSARSRSRLRHRARAQNAARYVTSVSDLPAATELSLKKKKKQNEKKKQKARLQTNTRRTRSTLASSSLDKKKKKKTTTSSSSRSASRSRTSSSRR